MDNINQKRVIVITGPSGVGKSTISRKLASDLGDYVDIDIETINYMIVDGFQELPNAKGLSFSKWDLAGDTIGLMANNFLSNDYQVVIHGHVNPELLAGIEKRVLITHRILLQSNVETVIARDKNRGKPLTMGEDMVREHYEYFVGKLWDDFIKIDRTDEDVVTTLRRIEEKL